METVISFLDKIAPFFAANSGVMLSVGAFILLFIAKVFPNSQAGPVVSAIQGFVDLFARIAYALGGALKAVSTFLGDLVKSNGILGKP